MLKTIFREVGGRRSTPRRRTSRPRKSKGMLAAFAAMIGQLDGASQQLAARRSGRR